MDEIFERIQEITAEQLDIEADSITMDTSFLDDLDADSLDIMELMYALEDEFGVELEDDEDKIATVADAVSYISERIN